MLKEQIATVLPKPLLRLVAMIIVASTIASHCMVASFSATSADGDVNVPVGSVVAKQEHQVIEETHLASIQRENKNKIEYISTRADAQPTLLVADDASRIERVDHAANNTLEADASKNSTLLKTTDVTLEQEDSDILVKEEDGFVYLPELPLSEEVQRHTYEQCVVQGLGYSLVLALMWRESRFDAGEVGYNTNGTQDSGLMQINDVNRGWLSQELGIHNLMDPYQNITAGTEMLGRMTEKHGMHNALMAYQYGEQGMLRKLSQGVRTNRLVEVLYSKSAEYDALIEKHQSA